MKMRIRWFGRKEKLEIRVNYLFAADDSAGLPLDDHVLGSAEMQTGRGDRSRLVEILHDRRDLLRRIELHSHNNMTMNHQH